ncbi:Tungstate uptake system ATP-binding protein TupC [Petrocella atlantisensis]|uniref:Tungstate uptake system ATP-binding protein TupC n=1 Tax=Petrocella atlantisensis TaxID=2173034 RepID=A0A3P7NUR6_9FIRM|nr:ABC transporter ATP-binding protein [Petrocella atlantisensis]VDN46625.1 Tungstate uptake system ATP-binding protein TupC [Petrocella atlantisensis]
MNIQVTNLIKKYQDKTVVDMNSIGFLSGNIYGVTGDNGAGKTTLLKILAGLENHDSGSIVYNDQPLGPSLMKKITYLSQTPYLMRSSVYENIIYPLKIRNVDSKIIERKAFEIMEELQVTELRDQLATQLSGGESQKVALSRALVFDPEVLLLDEPTASIDPATIEIIEEAIKKRNKLQNMTIIMISHNIDQVKRMCDEIIYMKKGKRI